MTSTSTPEAENLSSALRSAVIDTGEKPTVAKLRALLDMHQLLLASRPEIAAEALYAAAEYNQTLELGCLLEAGIPPDVGILRHVGRLSQSATALYAALAKRNTAAFILLCEAGANIMNLTSLGNNADHPLYRIECAFSTRELKSPEEKAVFALAIEQCLKRNVPLNSPEAETFVFNMLGLENADAILLLLQHGICVNDICDLRNNPSKSIDAFPYNKRALIMQHR